MADEHSTTTAVVIAGVTIWQDVHGRYSLNKLYEASGSKSRKEPSKWLENKSTQELIAELEKQNTFSCIDVVKGGNAAGTYAHELLAVSYAGWISPAFQLKVNQTFLDVNRGQTAPTLPVLHDSTYQLWIQTIIDLDATKYEVAELKAQHEAHDRALIAQQAQTIQALQQSQHATDMAREAVAATGRLTIEQFILGNKLLHQFPGKLDSAGRRSWPVEVDRLKGYCQAYGFEIIPIPVTGKSWPTENGYPIQALAWLCQHPTTKTQLTLVKEATTT